MDNQLKMDMADLLKKYTLKHRLANHESFTQKINTNTEYTPFIKSALIRLFDEASNEILMSDKGKIVGHNAISNIVDYCESVKDYDRNIISLESSSYTNDTLDTTVLKYTITKYGKEYTSKRRILEAAGFAEKDYNAIMDKDIDKFNKECQNLTPGKLEKVAAERVSTATKDFIADQQEKEDNIKDIYMKIGASVKKQNPDGSGNISQQDDNGPAMAEMAMKRYKTLQNNKPVSVMEALVINLSESAMKNDKLRDIYINEDGSLNIDSILDDAQALYTALETVNMSGLIKVDSKFIEGFVNSFKE